MFKRFITVLTVVALLCSAMSFSFSANASYTEEVLYGDVNGDGVVDTVDARLALQMAAGVVALENEEQLTRTDLNFDGYVTIFTFFICSFFIIKPSNLTMNFNNHAHLRQMHCFSCVFHKIP